MGIPVVFTYQSSPIPLAHAELMSVNNARRPALVPKQGSQANIQYPIQQKFHYGFSLAMGYMKSLDNHC